MVADNYFVLTPDMWPTRRTSLRDSAGGATCSPEKLQAGAWLDKGRQALKSAVHVACRFLATKVSQQHVASIELQLAGQVISTTSAHAHHLPTPYISLSVNPARASRPLASPPPPGCVLGPAHPVVGVLIQAPCRGVSSKWAIGALASALLSVHEDGARCAELSPGGPHSRRG